MWSLQFDSKSWKLGKSSAWGATEHDETWFKYPSAPLPLDVPLREVDIVPEGDIWTPNNSGVSASVNLVSQGLMSNTFTNIFRPKNFSVGGGVFEFYWYIGSTSGTYVGWEPTSVTIELNLGRAVALLSNFAILPKATMPSTGVVSRMVRYGVRQMIYAAAEMTDFTVVLSCEWPKPGNSVVDYFMFTRCVITRAKQTYTPVKDVAVPRPWPLSSIELPDDGEWHSQWEVL